jgi:hypothetical protein
VTDNNKPRQKMRGHKESNGSARGSRPIRLTELQKVLLVTGGLGHRLRSGRAYAQPMKKGQRRDDA